MKSLIISGIICALINIIANAQNQPVVLEAESGNLGSDFSVVNDSGITYITPLTDYISTSYPGDSTKIATFMVNFPDTGSYDLYVKVRVGSDPYNDDSFYAGNGFGEKSPTNSSDWLLINGIPYIGFAGSQEVVTGSGTTGTLTWKWINISEFLNGTSPVTFKVGSTDSTYYFQYGSRENGLDLDKIAFGKANLYYTVHNLENGEPGSVTIPNQMLTLNVDLSSTIRPVTHCAIGALYGITETLPTDINGMVAPLNPNVYVQPARAGAGYQQPIGAAIPVSERLLSTTGRVMIRLADLCPGWPYQWPGESSWLSQVTSVINDKLASGRSNYYGYEIWNEPYGTWQATNGDFDTLCWQPTYDLIRSLDSSARIIGPSFSYYNHSRMSQFLTYCKDNNCLPEIICWHELQGSANITSHISDYRSLENSLGISPRGISINEYCHPTHEYEGCPGTSAPFIAKFERNKVQCASISWWFTNLPGRLGSLLTSTNEKGGGWWFYKWYGDMTGNMVSVTPPNEYSDGIDGFACLDSSAEYASICLGGNNIDTVNVAVSGIPSILGDSVYVKVEFIPWTNKDTPVSGPTLVSNTVYTVTNGKINVPVNVTSPLYGYRVYISPRSTLIESGDHPTLTAFSRINIYPNPASGRFTVSLPGKPENMANLYIYSRTGILMKSIKVFNQKENINIEGLAPGLYILKLNYNNQSFTQKLIVK